jgi:hypothetical protein
MPIEDHTVFGLDSNCGKDANLQHLKHWAEGYRAYILGEFDRMYSPGSARDVSYQMGQEQAKKDTEL